MTATDCVSIWHTKNWKQHAAQAREVLNLTNLYYSRVEECFHKLVATPFRDSDFTTFAKKLVPDGKRLGRDMELYRFMGDDIMGWPAVIVHLVAELLLPIKTTIPDAYAAGKTLLLEWGREAYTAEQYAQFETIF